MWHFLSDTLILFHRTRLPWSLSRQTHTYTGKSIHSSHSRGACAEPHPSLCAVHRHKRPWVPLRPATRMQKAPFRTLPVTVMFLRTFSRHYSYIQYLGLPFLNVSIKTIITLVSEIGLLHTSKLMKYGQISSRLVWLKYPEFTSSGDPKKLKLNIIILYNIYTSKQLNVLMY